LLEGGLDEELVVAMGTDGVDGRSDAAGALVDAAVVARAAALGLDPERFLSANDADAYFRLAGGRIVTGATGTNVADLALYLRGSDRHRAEHPRH
jgi:glycerate-2-kinase